MTMQTNIDRFSKKTWRKSAPSEVVAAYSSGVSTDGRAAWGEYLEERPGSPLADASQSPLQFVCWGLDEGEIESSLLDLLIAAAKGKKASRLEKECGLLLEQIDQAEAIDLVALAHALPGLVATLSDDVWWGLLDQLISIAEDATAIDRFAEPLAHVLLACELPLVLGTTFTELSPCHKLVKSACKTLSASVIDLLDGEGMLATENFDLCRAIFASLTRVQLLTDDQSYRPLSKDAKIQYDWMVRQAIRLTRADGRTVFSPAADKSKERTDFVSVDAALFRTALKLGGDDDDKQIARLAIPTLVEPKPVKKKVERGLPDPSYESEWASAAVLRDSWRADASMIAFGAPGSETKIELQAEGRSLLRGEWDYDIRVDGRQVTAVDEWEQCCWSSDEEVDFLELEIELDRGVCLQRHVALAKEDSLALIADVVMCSEPTETIEYRASLPLARGVKFTQANESNEGHLIAGRRRATAIPLPLAEWQADRRAGHLDVTADGGVAMHLTGAGQNLYAAWLIDFSAGRLSRRLTWRHLTVAEYLVPQPTSVAAGYRIAIGDEQWLLYRSLAKSSNRTLLGHNLSTHMLLARFHETGEVEPLLEVE